MELFERVDYILNQKGLSRKALASKLGVPQSTFTMYFSVSRQDKLAPLLWKLAELWPDVPRNWLFFGEGEEPEVHPTLDAPTAEALAEAQGRIRELEAELSEERRLNRQLTARLLVDGVGDKTASPAIGKAADGQE